MIRSIPRTLIFCGAAPAIAVTAQKPRPPGAEPRRRFRHQVRRRLEHLGHKPVAAIALAAAASTLAPPPLRRFVCA